MMRSATETILLAGSYAPSLVNFRGPLIHDLAEAGWRVLAASPDIDEMTRSRINALGGEAISIPMSRTGLNVFSDLAYMNALVKVIRSEHVDRVLTYTIKPNIWGAFAARRAGVPSFAMVTGLGYAFTDAGEGASGGLKEVVASAIARALYARATRYNQRVIFQNPDDLADFTAAGCLARADKAVLVAGSGIDLQHFVPAPVPRAPRFLMISRLLKNKGVREYGDAALRVKAVLPQAEFDLVGYLDEGPDGIDPADLDRWMAGGLRFHGQQADVRPFLAACSAYVLPSYREGTPRSSLEAMATGRAIITTDAPGCRQTVDHGVNGLLVPVRDVDKLAQAMLELGRDEDRRASMGEASLALARDRFDVRRVNQAIIAAIEEAA